MTEPIRLYLGDEHGRSLHVEPVLTLPAGDHHIVIVMDESPFTGESEGSYIYLLYMDGPEEGGYDPIEGWEAEDMKEARAFAAHLSGTLKGHNLSPSTIC